MNTLVFAVFLAVAQAVVPIPRQAANDSTNASSEIKKQAPANKEPPTPLPAKDTGKPNPTQNDRGQDHTDDTEHAVTVRELPTVSVAPSWRETAMAICTIFLVFIGGGGVWAALRTLKAIERQADSMERQLRLVAADLHVEGMALIPVGPMTPRSYVAIRIKNYGGSRAERVRSYIRVTIPEINESEPSPEEFTIPPAGNQTIRFCEFIEFLNQETFGKLAGGIIKLKVSGRVTYMDIFGNPQTLELKEGELDPGRGTFNIGKPDTEKNSY